MCQAAASTAARDDRSASAGAINDDETPMMTAEGVAAALKAGTLNLRTEEWRRRLLASGLEEEDVLWIAAAVDDSSDSPFFCVMFAIEAALAWCYGVFFYILCGVRVLDLEPGLTVHRRVARLTGGVLIVFVVGLVCWMAESQRRWDKEVQEEQVLPILQLSLQNPPV